MSNLIIDLLVLKILLTFKLTTSCVVLSEWW